MSLRARPLPRFPRSSASCATRLCLPAHRAWNRQPRFKPSLLVACASQAYPAHPRPAAAHPQTSGTGLWTVAVVLGIGIGGALLLPLLRTTSPQHTTHETATPVPFAFDCLVDSHLIMAPNTPAGRVGTLTPDEERKLRQLWALTLQVFGVAAAANDTNGTAAPAPTPVSEAPVADAKKDKKKSRLSVFKRSKGPDAADVPAASEATTPTDISKLSLSAEDDKHGQNADFKAAIANMAPAELRTALWSMVKHDHPDALLLRFLRARKWDVEKALIMMISTMHWRLNEMHVDDDIVKNGELAALQNTTGDAKSRKNADDFLAQLRMGKSFLHGLDADGRPLCFVRARLHKAGEQTEESLERFTVHTIETARMLLRPPIDTATIVFDMTDFSLANMDYTPVKFMIKCFEANYPESLGNVLVYKAPWLFNAIWSIIRGWLDPVVAGKVHFAKNIDELSHYVPKSQIPTELGGDEKWEYKYPEPVPGENDKMLEEKPREELQSQRAELVDKYESTILDWVHAGETGPSAEERRRQRDETAEQLRQNYWKLDPYVRARSLYDRMGVLSDGGKLDFYGTASKENGAPVKPVVESSADDLD